MSTMCDEAYSLAAKSSPAPEVDSPTPGPHIPSNAQRDV
jgi:hypothetical protein